MSTNVPPSFMAEMSQQPKSKAASRNLLFIGFVVLAEPLSATLLLPFVYFMVRDFGGIEEQYIGYRAGLLTSAFFLPQLLTTTLWGLCSDKLGRKPILLVSLACSAFCIAAFGLSTSIVWALVSRGLCGVFNGNTSVTRTAVGELATQYRLNQAKAFSIFGLCNALGYVIGPLLGGLLANPVEHFGFAGPSRIFEQFPYLLPCLVSAVYNLIALGTSWAFLDETNQAVAACKVEYIPDVGDAETDPLLPSVPADISADPPSYKPSTLIACILGIFLLSLHAVIFDEGYVIFAASRREAGAGLGFSSKEIALSLSLMGPVIFAVQLLGFPFLNARFHTLALWRVSAMALALVYPLFSLLPQMPADDFRWIPAMRWLLLIAFLFVRFSGNVIAYTSISILINRVANPKRRGTINGLAQSGISLSRTIGPTLGGFIWSWSIGNGLPAPLDAHLLFMTLCILALIQFGSSFWIGASAASRN